MNNKQKIFTGIAISSLIAFTIYLISKKSYKKNKLKPNPKNVLFVGDSQTAIKNYSNNSAIKYTYPNFLIDNLKQKNINVDVLAKGGENTAWMLKNLPDKLKEKKFDRIYIQGGGNDAVNLVPYEKYKDNLEKMIQLGKEANADVIFMTWFDLEKVMNPDKVATTKYVPSKEEMYKRFKIYFDWQKKIGKDLESKADLIIPVFELSKEYVPDGIHPSAKGAKIVADLILKTF